MSKTIGANRNTNTDSNDKPAITLVAGVPKLLVPFNELRIAFHASVIPRFVDTNIFVRYFEELGDASLRGEWMGIFTMGTTSVFEVVHKMDRDNIYTGPISALLVAGDDIEIYVREY